MKRELENEMTSPRVRAIRLAKSMGIKIAQNYPEIANDYRSGKMQNQIVEKYNFIEIYGIGARVALTAVSYALHDLVPKGEMIQLEISHKLDASNSLTPEQQIAAGKKGGGISYALGLGFHSFTPEQKAEASQKGARIGGLAGTLARGQTPWSNEEKHYLLDLCQKSEYQRNSAPNKGKPDIKRIAYELESKFGNKRTTGTIKAQVCYFRSQGLANTL